MSDMTDYIPFIELRITGTGKVGTCTPDITDFSFSNTCGNYKNEGVAIIGNIQFRKAD